MLNPPDHRKVKISKERFEKVVLGTCYDRDYCHFLGLRYDITHPEHMKELREKLLQIYEISNE